MSGSRLRSTESKVTFLVLLMGLVAVPTGVASTNACDSFCLAKRLLTVLYPQFKGKDAVIAVSGKSSLDVDGPLLVFQTSILLPIPRKSAAATAEPPEAINHVTTFFKISPDPDGILEMQSVGLDINERKIKKLDELVTSHLEWSDSQVINAIESSGAKYAPSQKEALTSILPLKALEPLVGEVRVESITFQLRTDGHPPTPLLDWSVRFTATKSGKSSRYFLLLEPFDGSVSAFSRIPDSSKK
jgi:hypothetical protein